MKEESTKPKRKRKCLNVMSTNEVIQFFDACEDTGIAMSCLLMFGTGLRNAELCNLKWENINLKEAWLKVINGKGGKDRGCAIPPKFIPVIRLWKEKVDHQPYFLPHQEGTKLISKSSNLLSRYRRQLANANLLEKIGENKIGKPTYKYRIHDWRHLFGTYLYEKTGDVFMVSKSLGHARIQTTLIYTHMRDKKMKEAINKAFSREETEKECNAPVALMQQQAPMERLQIRFVNGEISKEEYESKFELLQT